MTTPKISAPNHGASWRTQAACLGEEAHFAALDVEFDVDRLLTAEEEATVEEALAICDTCPVAGECLAYCLKTEEEEAAVGVWGGTTPPDRDLIRRAALEALKKELANR